MLNEKLLFPALLIVATAAFIPATGMRIGWNAKVRPRLPLTQALQIAHEALNMEEVVAFRNVCNPVFASA